MGIVKPNRERQTRWTEEDVLVGVTITLTVDEARWLRLLLGNLGGDIDMMPLYLNKTDLKGIRSAFTDRLFDALVTADVPKGPPERVAHGKGRFVAGDSITIPLSWAKS